MTYPTVHPLLAGIVDWLMIFKCTRASPRAGE